MTAPFRVVTDPFDRDDIWLTGPAEKAYQLTLPEAVALGDALLAAAHAPRAGASGPRVTCFVCGTPVPAHLIKCAGACSPRTAAVAR